MPLTYRLTRAEYFAAQVLHARRQFRRRWWIWLLLMLGIFVWLQRDRLDGPDFGWVMAVATVLGVVVLLVLGVVLPWVQAATMVLTVWRRQPTLHQEMQLVIGDDGIRVENDRGNWLYRWSDMITRTENARVSVLYLAPNLLLVLPRRILTEADHATIRRHMGG